MSTPGAASVALLPKLLKLANESSGPYCVGGPTPPHFPSLSAIATTEMTFGLLAGVHDDISSPEFPAATTYVTPAETELLIAKLRAEDVHLQPKLRLAASICPAF